MTEKEVELFETAFGRSYDMGSWYIRCPFCPDPDLREGGDPDAVGCSLHGCTYLIGHFDEDESGWSAGYDVIQKIEQMISSIDEAIEFRLYEFDFAPYVKDLRRWKGFRGNSESFWDALLAHPGFVSTTRVNTWSPGLSTSFVCYFTDPDQPDCLEDLTNLAQAVERALKDIEALPLDDED